MNWNPAKKAQMLLLEPNVECYEQKALGTGIIPIAGSARAGKSTLMLALVEWAVKHTQRSFYFVGVPDAYIEALPDHIRSISSNPTMNELTTLRDGIVILDDTAVSMSSRDSATTQSRMINRIAGVISHLGLTLILTTQSMAGIDLSLLRYTEMAPLVKRVDKIALRVERSEWTEEIKDAQDELHRFNYDRSLYWSVADEQLCKHPFSEWMASDVLSRPFRYLSQSELDSQLFGENKTKQARKKVSSGE